MKFSEKLVNTINHINMKHLILCLVLILSGGLVINAQTTYTVLVGSNGFSPSNFTINAGDQVDFKLNLNTASGSHSSTSTNIPVGEASWNYTMTCGSCLYTVMPTTPGIYEYTDLNSGMSGSFTIASNTTGIKDNGEQKEKLSQNYPNPSSGITTIDYNIVSTSGEIVISDLSGKTIAKIKLNEPSGSIIVDENLSSGTYFYSLWDGAKFIETKKMTIK
jgi:plastocyanin